MQLYQISPTNSQCPAITCNLALKKYLKGTRLTRHVAQTIERITEKGITMKEMGFESIEH